MTPEQWQRSGTYAELCGHRIFYRDTTGSKPVLLLLHGFPTSSWDWDLIWDSLSDRFRLVAFDCLGLGFSDKPRGYDYTVVEQAEIAVQLLRQLSVSDCDVLAHDYGDTVAQELLARQVDGTDQHLKLHSVCFLNGGLFPETHRARLIQKLLVSPVGPIFTWLQGRKQFGRSFSAVFGAETQPSKAELDQFWMVVSHADGNRQLHRLLQYIPERRAQRSRWVGALSETDIPIRVICGVDDPVSGGHMLVRYRELISNPDIVELPGIGHYPHTEHPQGVLDAFEAFHTRLQP